MAVLLETFLDTTAAITVYALIENLANGQFYNKTNEAFDGDMTDSPQSDYTLLVADLASGGQGSGPLARRWKGFLHSSYNVPDTQNARIHYVNATTGKLFSSEECCISGNEKYTQFAAQKYTIAGQSFDEHVDISSAVLWGTAVRGGTVSEPTVTYKNALGTSKRVLTMDPDVSGGRDASV